MWTRIFGLLTFLLSFSCAPGLAPPPDQPGRHIGAAQVTQFSETVNLGATVRSTAQTVTRFDNVGMAIRTTGTAAGTWSVQYSNDFNPNVDDPTSDAKWDTYGLATTPPAAAGSAQVFGILLDSYEFAYVRVKFTYTSGAGSMFMVTQLKGN